MPRITNNNPDYFSVTWLLTTTCNYDCWYCEDYLHNGKHRWPDLKKSQKFFYSLADQHKTVFQVITGGEVTLWPDLINYIKEKPSNIFTEVCTNGSRSIAWWRRASKYLESVCITFHADTADPDHVLEVLKILSDSPVKVPYVYILASSSAIDKCYYLYDKIAELDLKINAIPKTIYNMGLAFPQELIDNNNNDPKVIEFINRPKIEKCDFDLSTIKATEAFLDGELLDIASTVIKKENSYKGWNCIIGLKRLSVLPNGDIFKGMCRVGGKIGNIYDDTLILPDSPQFCNKQFCTCIEELRLEKWKD